MGRSESGTAVTHGATAWSRRSGVISPPSTAVSWVATGQTTASARKNPATMNTSSSSVSSTHFSSAGVELVGSIGAKTSSSCRPWIPPFSLMSSASAW